MKKNNETTKILLRLMNVLSVTNYAQLSRLFRIDQGAISQWIKRDSIPVKRIFDICPESINVRWVLTGEGDRDVVAHEERIRIDNDQKILDIIHSEKILASDISFFLSLIRYRRKYPLTFEPIIESLVRLIYNVEQKVTQKATKEMRKQKNK